MGERVGESKTKLDELAKCDLAIQLYHHLTKFSVVKNRYGVSGFDLPIDLLQDFLLYPDGELSWKLKEQDDQ